MFIVFHYRLQQTPCLLNSRIVAVVLHLPRSCCWRTNCVPSSCGCAVQPMIRKYYVDVCQIIVCVSYTSTSPSQMETRQVTWSRFLGHTMARHQQLTYLLTLKTHHLYMLLCVTALSAVGKMPVRHSVVTSIYIPRAPVMFLRCLERAAFITSKHDVAVCDDYSYWYLQLSVRFLTELETLMICSDISANVIVSAWRRILALFSFIFRVRIKQRLSPEVYNFIVCSHRTAISQTLSQTIKTWAWSGTSLQRWRKLHDSIDFFSFTNWTLFAMQIAWMLLLQWPQIVPTI